MVGAVKPGVRMISTLTLAAASVVGCESIQNAITPPSMVKVAPEPVTPLAVPTVEMKGGRGAADAAYPNDYAAVVKPDGTIQFPEHTMGKIRGSDIVVQGDVVLSVNADGTIKGSALKHHYAFDADGALVSDDGHGLKVDADGSVRAINGAWKYQSIFAWAPDGSAAWDKGGWRTLELVALVVVENMLPTALRPPGSGRDGGKDDGLDIHIPPPSQWFK
jgi:hypothetical protein